MVLALIVLLGALEWGRLAGLGSHAAATAYAALMAVGLWASAVILEHASVLTLVLGAVAGWWAVMLGVLLLRRTDVLSTVGFDAPKAVSGLVVLLPSWGALVYLHGDFSAGPKLVLFLFVLIWVADSAAYFAGRRWGRVKLAPSISPGKSREGVVGALFGALVCGLAMGFHLGLDGWNFGTFVVLCIWVAFVSVGGDLYESLAKRQRGVKDSGHLLPGHGGVLDRIDSMTAAAPTFVFGLLASGAVT